MCYCWISQRISFQVSQNEGGGFGPDDLEGLSQFNCSVILLTAALQWPLFNLSAASSSSCNKLPTGLLRGFTDHRTIE